MSQIDSPQLVSEPWGSRSRIYKVFEVEPMKEKEGDMKLEANSSSPGSCGKFIEVVIMLILIGSYCCFIHGYYCSTTVNTARTKLIAARPKLVLSVEVNAANGNLILLLSS
ncbi:hypothetical protein Tco_0124171 [Tanacetum coccineum]